MLLFVTLIVSKGNYAFDKNIDSAPEIITLFHLMDNA